MPVVAGLEKLKEDAVCNCLFNYLRKRRGLSTQFERSKTVPA
ncbi:hypothetical protein HMPREF9452_02068 [Collinsella tanakaei YIT 12063]|uniref:Uncharacterized protein n=1 Tax=Collinsella tanakaei YIT 12063 TaxID=742742 RepID=G1WL55_9ACTN|nr:hypothetical protein HMPREF9452_02068 [Collinsella tanakaei YIT 12063]